MNLEVDGAVGELQLHLEHIQNVKKGNGHNIYKWQREVNESLFEACVRDNKEDVVKMTKEYQVCAAGVRDKNGRTALHYCCQVGSLVGTRLLLQNRAHPWAMDEYDILPCELALQCGHHDVIGVMLSRMLQDHDVSPKGPSRLANNVVPWWCDYISNEPEDLPKDQRESWMHFGSQMIKIVQKHSATKHLEEFMLDSAKYGQIARVRTLLDVGFDIKHVQMRSSVMDLAISNGHEELSKTLGLYPGFQCTRCTAFSLQEHLIRGAKNEDVEYVRAALGAGADPNHPIAYAPGKRSVLMCFAAGGNLDMCKYLVERNAQVACFDKHGCAAVHYARSMGHRHVEEYLEEIQSLPPLGLKGDEDIDSTYLHVACGEGCCAAVWRVLQKIAKDGAEEICKSDEQEAQVNQLVSQANGPYQLTPLHNAVDAAKKGYDPTGQTVQVLIAAKANVTACNTKGDTPLHQAALAGLGHLYQMLMDAVGRTHGKAKKAELSHVVPHNVHGQGTMRLLERSIKRKELLEAQPTIDECNMLKKVGFLAFVAERLKSKERKMAAHLNVWREKHAISFMDLLRLNRDSLNRIGCSQFNDSDSDKEAMPSQRDSDGALDSPYRAHSVASESNVSLNSPKIARSSMRRESTSKLVKSVQKVVRVQQFRR